MAGNDLKLLAIDDNQDNLTTLKAVVRDALPGCAVLTALNGQQGIELARIEDPDVFLLDIVMPGMDGYEVCRQLKADERLRSIPVVFLTALRTDRQSRIKALEEGAEAFLSKPLDEQELVAQIRAMSRLKAASRWERMEKEQLAKIVAERTRELEQELAERKRAEQELRESEDRYRSLVEESPDAIGIYQEGILVFINSTGVRQFGAKTKGELLGRKAEDLIHPEDQSSAFDRIRRRLAGEMGLYPAEVRYRGLDGTTIPAEVTATPITFGQALAVQFIARDITERKRLEEKLREAQKMESVGQLAGGVAHDFNNILAVTMMHLGLLQENTNLDAGTQESLKELIVDAQRAASLTRQLLMFSRRSILEVKVLDLNELVTNLLKMLGRLIGEHITVQFDFADGLPMVEADAGMMEQVVMNLAINARDAMPANGGKLTIRIESITVGEERAKTHPSARPGPFVCLSVADTGCGMNEATLQRIFEPFFTTKDIGKGTGLGLATVHGIVAQHKGWVEVESEPGKGTTFKVLLPATTKVTAEMVEKEKKAVLRGNESILLVEDEASVRGVLAQGLRRLGYTVFEAENGQVAMELWQEQAGQIDLLFSDMVMPEGLTGLDLAEKLKDENPNLKVIISSGYNAEMAGQARPAADGIMYLQKPYQIELLSKTVRDCLDKR